MACVLMGERKLKAASSNPEAPDKKVQRGPESADELMVDSAAPSWGQNITENDDYYDGKNRRHRQRDHGGQILGDKRQERGRGSQHYEEGHH